MVSRPVPDHISAAELRKEADRRELVERARDVYIRRDARNKTVDALLSVDLDVVLDSGSEKAFTELLKQLYLIEMADREKMPNNGEINMAGTMGWFDEWGLERISPHPVFLEIERGRGSWRSLRHSFAPKES